jgi:hypothetical protein
MFELQVENKGNHDLYVYVYDMGPYWQVENILRGSYVVIPSRNSVQGLAGALKKKMKTKVPTEIVKNGYRQCEGLSRSLPPLSRLHLNCWSCQNSGHRLRETKLAGLAEKVAIQQRTGLRWNFLFVRI